MKNEKVGQNNKITKIGDCVDISRNNNQKIIFNGSNNELILEYFNTLFNSENSKDVLIIEGDGNKVRIRHNGVVDNSINSCDTLIIEGDKKYFDLMHEFFVDNSQDSEGKYVSSESEPFEIIDNKEVAYVKDTSIIINKITNEFQPVYSVFEFYLKKAILGNPQAAFYLGEFYHMGVGALLDLKKAEYYYLIAAKQDHTESQSILGYLYEGSYDGIDSDINKAIDWYERAARQGDEYSIERLEVLKGY